MRRGSAMIPRMTHADTPSPPAIVLYVTALCPYCAAARQLLTAKGARFTTIDVNAQPERRAEMIERAGGRQTVPQIFFGARHIGGFDDLNALDRAGALDDLLQSLAA